jgi:hypothetical protein
LILYDLFLNWEKDIGKLVHHNPSALIHGENPRKEEGTEGQEKEWCASETI